MESGTPDPDRDVPAIRASDFERDATAGLLRQAHAEGRLTLAELDERTAQAYAARFQSELAELTRDLSVGHKPTPPPVHQQRAGSSPARRVTGGAGSSTSIAVMSGFDRQGPWTVAESYTAMTVMGGGSLDLREALLQSHETTIRVFAFMGGIEIVIPDDIEVEVGGIGFMGYFGEEVDDEDGARPVQPPPPGAPRVRVTGLAVWAGVSVRRVARR